MGFFDRLKAGLTKTREKLSNKIDELLGNSTKIDDELLDELEETLIISDVGTKTTEKLMENLRKGVKKAEINSPGRQDFFVKSDSRDFDGRGRQFYSRRPAARDFNDWRKWRGQNYHDWQIERVLSRAGQKSYGGGG